MKVVYARRVQTDIGEIFDYISSQDVAVALAIEAEIRAACDGVGLFPYANSPTDIAHVYRMPLPQRGFTIFNRVKRQQSSVEIARVVRSARVRNLRRMPRN